MIQPSSTHLGFLDACLRLFYCKIDLNFILQNMKEGKKVFLENNQLLTQILYQSKFPFYVFLLGGGFVGYSFCLGTECKDRMGSLRHPQSHTNKTTNNNPNKSTQIITKPNNQNKISNILVQNSNKAVPNHQDNKCKQSKSTRTSYTWKTPSM